MNFKPPSTPVRRKSFTLRESWTAAAAALAGAGVRRVRREADAPVAMDVSRTLCREICSAVFDSW